jgi:hypothetical protein
MDEYPWAVVASHIPNLTLRHNSVVNGSLHVDDTINPGSGNSPSTGTITDNAASVTLGSHGNVNESYNMFSGAKGTRDVNANPKFTGGNVPTTRAGFTLVAGSPGTRAASDGTDMGVGPLTVAAAPAAPVAPAAPAAPVAGGSKPSNAVGASRSSSRLILKADKGRTNQRFRNRLHFALDPTGLRVAVARVSFMVDDHWVGTDRKARFALNWRVPKGTRYGYHRLRIKAFAADGSSKTVVVTIRRVH